MGPISKLSNKELIKLAVARDIRNAVTLGFLEGARDSGLIENKEFCKTGSIKKFSKEATEFIADPALITEPLGGLIKGTAAAYNVAGTGLSHIFGDDATDEGVQRTMVEKRLLDRQADTLRSQRRNRVIAEVLKRRQQGTQPMMRY
jgi:hypothetical protein